MQILTRGLSETAVYWAPATTDRYGRKSFSAATTISCRWEDIQEEFFDTDHTKQISQSRVFVDREVQLGGYLYLGTYSSLSSTAAPEQNSGAFRVLGRKTVKNIDATKTLRYVLL